MSELVYNNCFACGKDNPIGLKLKFEYSENCSISYFVVSSNFQGYHDITHGGIITTLLDEAMAKIILFKGIEAVTGEINVKFRRAVPTNKEIRITGRIEQEKSRTIKTSGKIEFDGKVCAEATATFVKMKK
ncbi:MAG: PaaI family thioesterase [Candidatus Cloacimonadales bacterium]